MSSRLDDLKSALSGLYEIDREVGQGGMANVYLARDTKHNRDVAVKVLRPELATALGPDRFLREIEIAANLMHPHILPLYDSGDADGFLYYVMPYVKGDTLRQRVEKEGELPITEAVRIIREVVDALAFAHSQGVVHRDIKPDNVMISGRHALVTDFGVAKAVSEATGKSQLTTAGVALGTPAYMAPEQATADPHVDHRADIYAVGAMAYELLTGRPPFIGHTPQAVLAAHVTEQVEPVTKHRDQVPAGLEAVVMKCLAKKPADRWQTAEEMLPHLELMATSSGGLTPAVTMPVSAISKPSWTVGPALLGLVAVVVIGIFGTQMLLGGGSEIHIVTSNQRQVTSNAGLEYQQEISGDGDDVVYLTQAADGMRLWVRNLAGGVPIEVAAEMSSFKVFPRWNASGQMVRFAGCRLFPDCGFFEVSKQGGTVTEITPSAYHEPPAGSANLSGEIGGSNWALESPGLETPVDLSTIPQWHSGMWSPDGTKFALVDRNPEWVLIANIAPSAIKVVDLGTGEILDVTTAEFLNVSPIWLPDSRHLLFVSNRDGPRGAYVIEVGRSGPVGEPRLIPGVIDPHSISISADGRRLAYSRHSQQSNIWSTPMPNGTDLSPAVWRQETFGNQLIEVFDVSDDGDSLLYDSGLSGNMDLYRSAAGQENAVRLTTDPANDYVPIWSSDRREVAFYSLRTGAREIFVMPATPGATAQQLTHHGTDARRANWSPDGLTLAYVLIDETAERSQGGLFRMALLKREAIGAPWSEPEITDLSCDWAVFSPSGDNIVCSDWDRVYMIDLEGEVVWEWTGGPREFGTTSFLSDGSLVVQKGTTTTWEEFEFWLAYPLTGREPTLLLREPTPQGNWSFEATDDRIFMNRPRAESDIWVMDLEY